MDDPKLDRTWLCSVVFLDIVSYSSQSVQVQMKLKKRFNQYLGEALKDVAENDRVILDTGDGAAVCFLGAPEAAMFTALQLRNAFVHDDLVNQPGLRVRIGVNLGPLKLVRDLNGNLNAIGDGINTGQRVMSFAGENKILVSRSFYEVVSCLSDSYDELFRFEGVKKDKHVREHLVYELIPPGGDKAAQPAAQAEVAPPPTKRFDGQTLDRLEALLLPYLGPITRQVIKIESAQHSTLEDLISSLASQLAQNRSAFLAAASQAFGAAKSAPAPHATSPNTPPAAPLWTPELLDRAKKELAHYIGPMARFIVDRAAKSAQNPAEFYAALSEEIPTPRDRERFRAAMTKTQ